MREAFESLAFDPAGPLPAGVFVLEASAGTGKTYTIAALAARYVAEGTPIEQLLLITFTRMATGELRERVRERLIAVRAGLEHVLAGIAPPRRDEIVELFAADPPELLRRRCHRLHEAIADFDAATIATTHGFCQEVLVGLGIAADLEPEITFAEDLAELTEDVVDDLYVRRFHAEKAAALPFAEVTEIARIAIENPSAPIVSGEAELPAMRGRLAQAVREELERRKRGLAVMTYDDLLTRLEDALRGTGGETIAARLRERFSVVLIDEFQDTDAVQWDIVRRAFGGPDRALVLIGDPKQAIYAFRGADVYSYLQAKESAGASATLRVNWRSDQGLIDAYDALLAGTRLGHEGIEYRQVRAADANQTPRLTGAPVAAPLRVRVVPPAAVKRTAKGWAEKPSTRRHIAQDLSGEVVALLESGARIERRREDGTRIDDRAVAPGDIAVLVPTNRAAAQIREALHAAGVPAVTGGAGSVFETEPAGEWLRLLEAIEQPASALRAHSAALTSFFGWDAVRVADAGTDEWEEIHRRLHECARVLRDGGVASLLALLTATEGLPARLLAAADGERRLTDLRHVAQLLQAQAVAEQLGATALTAWLRRRIAEAGEDNSDEERSRRLESDAAAVQVLTIHRSKGLEFPVVMLPFLWEPGYIPEGELPVIYHDQEAGETRTIDVALEGGPYREHRQLQEAERRGEDLRLAYVALTRARHQTIVWWASSWDTRHAPLTRLLFSRDAQGTVAAAGRFTPSEEDALKRLRLLAEQAPEECIAVETADPRDPAEWSPPAGAPEALGLAAFTRGLDLRWRRTSYTDITSGAHEDRVGSEAEEPLVGDEPAAQAPVLTESGEPPPGAAWAVASPLAAMPFGAEVGTFVHSVLEATDFAAAELDVELSERIDAVAAARGTDVGDPAAVRSGLRAVLETPLGPLAPGIALRDVARGDRLDELGFELPLAGGERPRGWVRLERIAALLREHLGPEDPLAGYAERLGDPALRQQLRGYLTGSLDLVVRLRGDAGGDRFLICDYKTNWLAPPDEPLIAWHHRPAVLRLEMQRRHYGLQALLYTVALHRYLRWRLSGYAPEQHLGGVLYLFLRGMLGPDTPAVDGLPSGVFAWRPPAPLVLALSDALAEGTA